MTNAISISGSTYTVTGTVTNQANNEGVVDLHVLVYDKDLIHDDFLGIAVTDKTGTFTISFDASKFGWFVDRSPDLYFIVKDAGLELLNTKGQVINEANESTAPINFKVDLSNDKLRADINPTAVPGWVGGFEQSNPAFAYPTPDLSSLPMLDNLANIDKLQRQQKVLWPEFSWETEPGEANPKRCYQMFAPDISRVGYTNEGRIYSLICPQQGAASSKFGSMNVEVTVTGNRGWVDESTREMAGTMGVEAKIWFSPSAHENPVVKRLFKDFIEKNLPFPSDKANAITIKTHMPGNPSEPNFPFSKGLTTAFEIPNFAKHDGIAWTMGNLQVQIGEIVKTGIEKVDNFNQKVVDVFNASSGNMLQKDNILTWNVWFTAPEVVDQVEWAEHAEKWRKSIDADHGSPEGPGTDARFFDGSKFEPLREILEDELLKFIDKKLHKST